MSDDTDRNLYETLIKFFSETKTTGWGKVQIVQKIKDIYIEVLSKRQS